VEDYMLLGVVFLGFIYFSFLKIFWPKLPKKFLGIPKRYLPYGFIILLFIYFIVGIIALNCFSKWINSS